MLEGVHLLRRTRLTDLHLVKLSCHHLLCLHVCKLLFHHCHGCRILSLCWVGIALGVLHSPSISHDHALHHVGQRVGAKAPALGSIGLASPTRHSFVKHFVSSTSLVFDFKS